MKPDKQRLNDYKIEKKALKTESKAAKKEVSKAKSQIKKKTKLIAKTERELGHWYYQEQKRSTDEGRRKLQTLCTVISSAEQTIRENSERRDIFSLRVDAIKKDLKAKKKALKTPEISEVTL